jgi:hypothetical protein
VRGARRNQVLEVIGELVEVIVLLRRGAAILRCASTLPRVGQHGLLSVLDLVHFRNRLIAGTFDLRILDSASAWVSETVMLLSAFLILGLLLAGNHIRR